MNQARERWDRRYRSGAPPSQPAALLDELASLVPKEGTMVDVAGGAGRNALWFAERGLVVTLLDVSPEALAHAQSLSELQGLSIECIERDLESEGLPGGRSWDVALMHLYSNRAVLSALPKALEPGGLLIFAQPTVLNLERHERPARRFLLASGEIADLATQLEGMEIIEASEAWRSSGRHEARLVARRLGDDAAGPDGNGPQR